MLDPIIEPSLPFTDLDLDQMEEILDRKLPDDYRTFVKEYGGPFIGGIIDGPQKTSILGFSEADEYQGELSLFKNYEDLKEIGALPFAFCVFGNIYVLTAENEVYYIDYYDRGGTSALKIAISFSDFLSRIIPQREDQWHHMEEI